MERLDRPEKNWKFSPADVAERQRWKEYMKAYEEMIARPPGLGAGGTGRLGFLPGRTACGRCLGTAAAPASAATATRLASNRRKRRTARGFIRSAPGSTPPAGLRPWRGHR